MILTTKPITVTTAKIAANKSPPEACLRLVHNGAMVLGLFESSGFTWTRNVLFCATTEKECLDEIARLKLEYAPVTDVGQPETSVGSTTTS